MTKEQAFKEINETQNYYVNELMKTLNNVDYENFKTINFTSDTGTGKTKMMSKLINLNPEIYFIVTTLSKGQLNKQVENDLKIDCKYNNFKVYGTCDYKINSKLEADDIINAIPKNHKCIWLRDEGHIKTNRFDELLIDRCFKTINFSATNQEDNGIRCNFTNTMMLRTVIQDEGTPEDAIKKLLEIKKQHKKVKDYNPCAIFRCIDGKTMVSDIEKLCNKYNLKYINITEEDYIMSELCEDNNEYDVIINKFKIVEGINIKRAHVLYMDNQPKNNSTTIQVIGRCRRNALLYNNQIDIFEKENEQLLENTRQCFVFYNVKSMRIDNDENGNLISAFCDKISVEKLKCNSIIEVKDGKLPNGLKIIELEGETGKFEILKDEKTGFNIVKPEGQFYEEYKENCCDFLIIKRHMYFYKYQKEDIKKLTLYTTKKEFNYGLGEHVIKETQPYYRLDEKEKISCELNDNICKKILLLLEEEKENFKNIINEKIQKSLTIKEIKGKNKRETFINKINENKKYIYNLVEFRYYNINVNRILSNTYGWEEILYDMLVNKKNLTIQSIKKFLNLYKNAITIEQHFTKSEKKALAEVKKNSNIHNEINEMFNFLESIFTKKIFTYYKYRLQGEEVAFESPIVRNKISYSTQDYNIINIISSKKYITLTNDGDLLAYKTTLDDYKPYKKIINDRESAIVGVDTMKVVKNDEENIYIEDRAVTSKVNQYCKFNSFIQHEYKSILDQVKPCLYTGINKFNFDKKCNQCLGYLVEYFSKYLVYGEEYLGYFIAKAQKESNFFEINDYIIVRACMLKYKQMMKMAFGNFVDKIIPTISIDSLIKETYKEFVNTVIELGTKTAKFIKNKLYFNVENPKCEYDPNLSIKHIAGLADYITQDTILDVKTTNHIDISMIKQVLAYKYLSTKRSDLSIKKLYVYDATSNKAVFINLESQTVELIDNSI